jgi:hypothetical protein
MCNEWTGKDLKGNFHGLIRKLSRHLPGDTEKNYEKSQS